MKPQRIFIRKGQGYRRHPERRGLLGPTTLGESRQIHKRVLLTVYENDIFERT